MALAHDALALSTIYKPKKGKDETIPDSVDMTEFLRSFAKVYTHTICFFAARPHVALELHKDLIRYRIRLMDLSLIYRFDSVRTYHYAFMGRRMLSAQDDPIAWRSEDYNCTYYLIPRPKQAVQTNSAGKGTATSSMPVNAVESTAHTLISARYISKITRQRNVGLAR